MQGSAVFFINAKKKDLRALTLLTLLLEVPFQTSRLIPNLLLDISLNLVNKSFIHRMVQG